ncbi:MAG: hypothetical protein ABSC05_37485 [Candidatus Solibacter sp.]|jgi:hypothetical protein
MNHLSEEQLILHYYGETGEPGETGGGDVAGGSLATGRHLEECGECRALYASLQRVLNVVDGLPVPERSAAYGAEVWQRIEHRLGARRRTLWMLPPSWRLAAAGAAFAALMVTAFVAGRFYPRPNPPARMAAADAQTGERVLLVAVGDYLERSQMVLIELTNANPKGSLDISAEQERAGGLVTETRLYRQTAARTGDARITGVLDDLERVLVDITHAPSNMTPPQLEELRQRLEAEGILFKIRVLGSNVRNQELPDAPSPRQTL